MSGSETKGSVGRREKVDVMARLNWIAAISLYGGVDKSLEILNIFYHCPYKFL